MVLQLTKLGSILGSDLTAVSSVASNSDIGVISKYTSRLTSDLPKAKLRLL
jgi:hypothetical protein